jgi:hypothetical protein
MIISTQTTITMPLKIPHRLQGWQALLWSLVSCS